jgi:hypothetical protein
MKKRLRKNRKYHGPLGVVLYSSEWGTNECIYNDRCNVPYKLPDGTNVRCIPPESTREGARNVRCNLAANC